MTDPGGTLRIDRLLWFLRLARTRSAAQAWIASGHVRRNGRRVERTSQPVAPGDVLTLPIGTGVQVVEVVAMPRRRGPPAEARGCYRVPGEDAGHQALDDSGQMAIAPGATQGIGVRDNNEVREGDLQP
ncbi:RNA-binding S4 domain-containing protein [Novosphingobium tardum]|uniref:RNA-binding S4 domain-containing protein n=1 Tax=Novosphingobium tardum TaxID=1538021 RepID=A0ABV8RMA8_9SPHN